MTGHEKLPVLKSTHGEPELVSTVVKEETKAPFASGTCGRCRYAQNLGGFRPGMHCLNRKSPNYLRRITVVSLACAQAD